jgi:DNA-binding transcriptional ArsR family regulator
MVRTSNRAGAGAREARARGAGAPEARARGAGAPGLEPTYLLDDPLALRALAHPLRGNLLAALRFDGPATASMLGRRFGESSGSTSYHLRILARHGFVEDDPDHAGGRERWWRAAHATTTFSPAEFMEREPGDRESTRAFLKRVARDHFRWLDAWLDEMDRWPVEWVDATTGVDRLIRLTPEQLKQLSRELEELTERWAARESDDEDAERVMVIAHTFPARDPLA